MFPPDGSKVGFSMREFRYHLRLVELVPEPDSKQIPDAKGTWQFDSAVCGGAAIVLPGYKSEYRIGDGTAERTIEFKGCAVVQRGIPVTVSSGALRLDERLATKFDCTPSPCDLVFDFGTKSCPTDFPNTTTLTVASVTDDRMTTTDPECEIVWRRTGQH